MTWVSSAVDDALSGNPTGAEEPPHGEEAIT
jgi:hypothetical protein